jgi:hypothetical protein
MDTEKTCTRCGVTRPIESFYKSPGYRGGRHTWCKSCVKTYYAERYKENPQLFKERNKEYLAADPARKRAQRERHKNKHPDRYRANKNLNSRIRRGTFPHVSTQVCRVCGVQAQEYHHWSYAPEHWFDVVPMCNDCHDALHLGRLQVDIPVP